MTWLISLFNRRVPSQASFASIDPEPVFRKHGFNIVTTESQSTHWGKRFPNGTLVYAGDARDDSTHQIKSGHVGFVAIDYEGYIASIPGIAARDGVFEAPISNLSFTLATLAAQLAHPNQGKAS